MPLPPKHRRTIERILADPRYWDPAHPEHNAMKAEATRAFRAAYPEPAATAPASTIHVRGYTRRHNGRTIEVSDYDRTTTIARSPASAMAPSEEGLAFLKANEGYGDFAYVDRALKNTIGYGHRIRPGESFPTGVSRDQAERLFAADVAEAASAVRRLAKVELTQSQFDALVSLVYNVGSGAFARSRMLGKLNAGDAVGAATEFDDWDKITTENGKPERVPGLTARRAREKSLFLTGAYP
ncbi:MAG: lysozyme [Gemmatimonas sp.]